LDHIGLQARAFGSATDYQKDGGVTPSFGALFSDTFFDDTFGILVAGDYTNKHILATISTSWAGKARTSIPAR